MSDDPELNPGFADYYKVFFHYCSSDMYIGDREASPETAGYHFRGRAHMRAIIDSLKTHTNIENADTVIFTGTSAGGRGAAFNTDLVAAMLPEVDVRCVVDAAIFYPQFDTNPYDPDCRHFNDIVRDGNEFWNGHVDEFDVDTWWEDFPYPLFIGMQMFDNLGFSEYYCGEYDTESLMIWGEGMLETCDAVVNRSPHVGFYVPACYRHVMLQITAWFLNVPAGSESQSYHDTLLNWLRGEGPIHVYDACPGTEILTCNPHCIEEGDTDIVAPRV